MLASVAAMGLATFSARSGTVAYWPLAYENGVRTTTATVFANQGDGGTLDAVPSSRQGASWIAGSDYCPQGTNAFPVDYGVWDPVSGTNAVADSALYFHKTSLAGYAGALRVANPAALRLTTFTVECFVRMQQGTAKGDWNCIAVMPAQLPGSGGTPANYESWGMRVTAAEQIQIRFSKDKGSVSANLASSDNTILYMGAPNLYDGRWHHVAFSVDGATRKAIAYFDHAYKGEKTLPESVCYKPGMNLFIGNTPQTTGPFGGSIAHFRISDTVLTPPDFLHFTRTERAGDEDPDALLHLDFEPPAGLSATQGFFNDAAVGPAVHHYGAEAIPATVAAATPFPQVYAGLLDEVGRTSAYCMTNNTSGATKNYVAWAAPEDVFTNTSFTVECCYKTTMTSTYVPLVRRRGGSNVQFNLGFGGTAGRLSATVFQYYASTGNDGAARVVDSEMKTVTLFKDGGIVGSQTYNGMLVPAKTGVCIGGVDNGSNFPGLIDNVRVTMRALPVGEFLRPDHVVLSGKTLAWASFDNALDAATPAYALTNGAASASAAGGSAPSFAALGAGERIEDGAGNVLRRENLATLSCSTGVVKYAANTLLPLIRDQTIEFRVKADAQAPYAGLVRCNIYRDSADIPVWGLSTDATTGTRLRVRCATAGESSWNYYGINEDTPVVVCDGRWHHVALTLSQTNGQVTASIHKDYEATPSWTKTVSGSLCYGSGYAPVWVGASSSTTAFFNGEIDELRISRGVLAPSDFLRRGKLPFILVVR